MASLLGLLRKTVKRGTNLIKRVGKVSRRTLKRGTNAVGITKRRSGRKGRRSSRRSSRRQSQKQKQ
jgi:hypothetical protein